MGFLNRWQAELKIFVTGADGFIGSHVVEELVRRGHRVKALVQYNSLNSWGWLDSLPSETMHHVEVVEGDIRDHSFIREVVAGYSRVAHLAALIAIPFSYVAPRSYIETNVLGTMNVLDACRYQEVERVVHTSTSEVYGTAQYVPISELHPLVGQSPYSASKIGADQVVQSYWSSFALPVTTVRPFNTYGPRQSQRAFIPAAIGQLLSRPREIRLGSLAPTRDLTYVTDTARGFADVLESTKGLGETFNMGSGYEVSMRKVLEMLFEISGLRPKISSEEKRVRPGPSEVERLWSDSSKIFSTFGWAPSLQREDGLFRGLEATYEWFERAADKVLLRPDRYVL